MNIKTLSTEIDYTLQKGPFSLTATKKYDQLLSLCKMHVDHHKKNCDQYNNWWLSNIHKHSDKTEIISDIPFLPSSVFKHSNLISSKQKFKKISSSGTSSQLKSNIFIDSKTSKNQTSALSKILSHFLGKKRKAFFVVDYEPNSAKFDSGEMSARFAGMSGYLMAAKKRHYLLEQDKDNNPKLSKDAYEKLIVASKEGPVVIIGYTYMLFQFLENDDLNNLSFLLHKDSHIIHFGGWKKLASKKISKENLNTKLSNFFGIAKASILDIYGFTEQLGTIYVSSGDDGCRVTDYTHVIVRDTKTLQEVPDGEKGFLQFISCISESYPGFSILNDDIGYISKRYIDNEGKEVLEFKVTERLKQAEARGCGDTLPEGYFI